MGETEKGVTAGPQRKETGYSGRISAGTSGRTETAEKAWVKAPARTEAGASGRKTGQGVSRRTGARTSGRKTGQRPSGRAGTGRGASAASSSSVSSASSAAVGTHSSAAGARARRADRRTYSKAGGGAGQPLTSSFRHAFDGILYGIKERNMKIHMGFALLVVVFGILLEISVTEWCLCFVLFGLVMGLELVNTALEAVVDLVTKDYKPLAGHAKDAAAGAVLVAAIMAAITGLVIFIPRLVFFFRSL